MLRKKLRKMLRKKRKRENPLIDMWSRKELLKVYLRGDPLCMNIEINERCAGGCRFCYASSKNQSQLKKDNLSWEMFQNLLRLKTLGAKVIYFYGGDQLLHPKFKDMLFHAIQQGFHIVCPLSALISESQARWLTEAQQLANSSNLEFFIGIHIDTLDQNIYNQINSIPGSLQKKIDGYNRLLEAGFPPDHVYGCPTLTNKNASTMITLMDWFYEKGAKHVAIVQYRPLGMGRENAAEWEPSLTQIEEVFFYRAKIEGKHMLAVGSSDGKYACKCHVGVTAQGDVVPCLLLRDLPEGNIYKEDFLDIVKRGKKNLLFHIKVKGPCRWCKYKLYCFGCRANAYLYTGDIHASDPKCFFNSKAPERCLK
ncbi:MAG: radical SAM protein [Candidatus Lokiarchaeota archaeon]|nr:radical SAM protein [Candidatus Lokiarchaeota archaeon]